MARVIYGVMSVTNGHLSRSLAIANRLTEHDFFFVGGDRLGEAVASRYPVLTVPVLRTHYRHNRTDLSATCFHGLRNLATIPKVCRQIRDLIDRWQPDLALCDFEFYLPLAARAAGLKCVSIDHQHILRAARYPVPAAQWVSRSLAMASFRMLYDFTPQNLIVSFFHPPLKFQGANELLPPVLRPAVTAIPARPGDHVLIYLTTPTFTAMIDAARQLSRPVIVYGFRNQTAVEGNLTFKPFDPRAILEDLAGSAYAVVNGGHNVICEALHYRKPVLAFPIALDFEKFLNAWHVRALGYGDFSTSRAPAPALFRRFESRLDEYRANIERTFVDGTPAVVQRVRELINEQGGK